MSWIGYSLLGSFLLVILNTISRLTGFSLAYWPLFIVLSVATTFSYGYAWKLSPNFLQTWFVQSAMVSVGAFVAAHVVHETGVTYLQVVGILLIITGGAFIR